MRILTQTGLVELIAKIKASFIKVEDVAQTTTLDIDLTPTASSSNLVTSGGVASALSSKEPADATILKQANVVDNVTSTTTNMPLSANQGKVLNDRIDNLSQIGRYLALWDCTTGKPTSNPTTTPYTYKAGDYYRVSNVTPAIFYRHTLHIYDEDTQTTNTSIDINVVIDDNKSTQWTFSDFVQYIDSSTSAIQATGSASAMAQVFTVQSISSGGSTAFIMVHCDGADMQHQLLGPERGMNTFSDTVTSYTGSLYRPSGTSYNNEASTVVETEDVQVGDVYFCDGTPTSTNWSLQINHIGGLVEDVKIDTTSIVSSGTATLVSGQHTLPSQTSQSGKYLTTNGSVASWGTIDISSKEDVSNKVTAFQATPDNTHYPSEKLVKDSLDAIIPSQSGNSGKFLTTNGTTTSWDNVNATNVIVSMLSAWTAMSGLASVYYTSVTYGNDRFVCVGDNGKSYYSTNGTSWNAMSGLASTYYTSVTYGNGRFVCVGQSGSSYYSTDGTTWTAMSGLPSIYYNSVTYGNGRFVCVGYSGSSYYSTDGTTWTAMSGLASNVYIAVTYGNGRFVCVGSNGKSYYSTNGTTWAAMSGLASTYYNSVTYGNGRFVCVGEYGYSYYSTDGITWAAMTGLEEYRSYYGITCGNNIFVCVGSSGASYYSTNGTSWTAMSGLDTTKQYGGVTCGNGRFICVGQKGASSYMPILFKSILEYVDNNKEAINNKVTTISSSSTDTQYPSAKAVYDAIQGSITNAIGGEF